MEAWPGPLHQEPLVPAASLCQPSPIVQACLLPPPRTAAPLLQVEWSQAVPPHHSCKLALRQRPLRLRGAAGPAPQAAEAQGRRGAPPKETPHPLGSLDQLLRRKTRPRTTAWRASWPGHCPARTRARSVGCLVTASPGPSFPSIMTSSACFLLPPRAPASCSLHSEAIFSLFLTVSTRFLLPLQVKRTESSSSLLAAGSRLLNKLLPSRTPSRGRLSVGNLVLSQAAQSLVSGEQSPLPLACLHGLVEAQFLVCF